MTETTKEKQMSNWILSNMWHNRNGFSYCRGCSAVPKRYGRPESAEHKPYCKIALMIDLKVKPSNE